MKQKGKKEEKKTFYINERLGRNDKLNQIKSILLPYELQVSHFTNKHNTVYDMRLE